MPERDVTFTFDEKPFQNGMRKVTRGMGSMETSAKKIARGVSAGMGRVLAKVGALAAGFLAVRNVLRGMPEVGQAFGIAKGIFLKNLLFPLRREIMPLLQKMLDWVREHRTAFTRWGQILVGVFRAGMTIIRQFLKIARQVGAAIFGDLSEFERRMNLFLFKVSLAAIFIGELLRPVAVAIGEIVKLVARLSGAFLRGFIDSLAGIGEPLEKIGEAFRKIAEAIFGTDFEGYEDFFEKLGGALGTVVVKTLEGIAAALEWIADMIERIRTGLEAEGFQQTWGWLFQGKDRPEWGREAEGEFKKEMESRGGGFLGWLRSTFEAYKEGFKGAEFGFGPPKTVRDVIITKRGQVVETHPEDTISASRGGQLPFGGAKIQVTNHISVSVTEGSAEAAGRLFGEGMAQGLREKIMDDMVRAGG